MLHIDLTTDDSRMVVSQNENGVWEGVILDSPTGKTAKVGFNNVQLSAIVALALGLGEDLIDTDETLVDRLVEIAEPCFKTTIDGKDFPKECRMIP